MPAKLPGDRHSDNFEELNPVDYGPHAKLTYEQMLMTRYALQNARSIPERHSEIDRSATVLLARLVAQGPMSVGELADAFGLDVSTVHRQVAAAMRAELIERIPDPAGGQARLHRPTAEGTRRLNAEINARIELIQSVTADWTQEETDTFVALMTKFNRSREKLRGQQWPRPYLSDTSD
ncbi:MarR family winged helix-turn-helix transcriptional regulator [Corynebacterium sp. A21]|uniref:MarR family winged helix-turn-helix transcriptional regulator n=1 Tax=Corynebacterium sp. A21 TaxID=3457318 RepID=UPI003FD5E6FD